MTKISVEIQARRGLAAAHRLTVVEGYREGTWNHYSSNTRNSLTTDARAYPFQPGLRQQPDTDGLSRRNRLR